jgi:hypothetical protein
MVGDDTGRLQVGELDESRKRAGRTALGRPLMCGHALRRRRHYAFGRLDNRADDLGRALRERRRRSVLLLRMDAHRALPLRPRRRVSRMQRSPGLGAGAIYWVGGLGVVNGLGDSVFGALHADSPAQLC